MQKIDYHEVPGVNQLDITVLDAPGPGGAHHEYEIAPVGLGWSNEVTFQNGPVKESGVNGVTNEALLAIVQHRLECFQAGPFACDENAGSLVSVKLALEYLKSRTRDRMARGVEGENKE